jgi:hypothetical protein
MSLQMERDPRAVLVKDKYFTLKPKPLERWLWTQGLPQAAERVFWLHWEEGKRHGDWCSEIPVKRVARECCVDVSTVSRSYQLLKSKGLIKREDPGRDPRNPFCQATAITEVRLPREFLTELSRSPNRPVKEAITAETSASPPMTLTATAKSFELATGADSPPISAASRSSRPTRQETQAMWSRASEGERARFFRASQGRLTCLEFDAETSLTAEDRGQILAQLAQLAAAKPAPAVRAVAGAKPVYTGPRRLNVLDLARTRKRILDSVPGTAAEEILRQVVWAVEEGALRRFEIPMALNIALKKIREGAWSKPNRLPPNWVPGGRGAVPAVPEQCSAA